MERQVQRAQLVQQVEQAQLEQQVRLVQQVLQVQQALQGSALTVYTGTTWTTDAPFRETETAIGHAQTLSILAVEMEAAALYAFATTQQHPVVCFAHVTNQMAQKSGDFEKGAGNGSHDALQLIKQVASQWQGFQDSRQSLAVNT